MRDTYHEQLSALTADIAKMCGLASEAMAHATRALLQADLVLAERVISEHEQITTMSARAEEAAFLLLALQAPVAGELRAVVTSTQNAANVERMGALALHVAKITRRRYPAHALPDDVNDHFAKMGRVAVALGTAAQEALQSGDPDKAARLRQQDEEMNDLHRGLFTVLMDRTWTHGVTTAVDVTLLSRFYERFADHAVEIARRVIFRATGELPDDDRDPS